MDCLVMLLAVMGCLIALLHLHDVCWMMFSTGTPAVQHTSFNTEPTHCFSTLVSWKLPWYIMEMPEMSRCHQVCVYRDITVVGAPERNFQEKDCRAAPRLPRAIEDKMELWASELQWSQDDIVSYLRSWEFYFATMDQQKRAAKAAAAAAANEVPADKNGYVFESSYHKFFKENPTSTIWLTMFVLLGLVLELGNR